MWQANDAARLAEITPGQLREWTLRRKLVVPDVAGQGPGRHALYSWPTILTLSILGDLRQRFGIEIGQWTDAAAEARRLISERSFIALWNSRLCFSSHNDCQLTWRNEAYPGGGLSLPLDPHLRRLAAEMRFPEATAQLALFSSIGQKS